MKSTTTMGEDDYTHDDMAALHEECQAKIDLLQATIDYSGSNVQLIDQLRKKLKAVRTLLVEKRHNYANINEVVIQALAIIDKEEL